jgi:NADPH:quinone reductase-like Zn-dependent oxidoreductase
MTPTTPVRTYRLAGGAGIDGLTLHAEAHREPGPGEVAVAVRAVSLSYRELLVARGAYVLPVKADVIPVSDGAGEVAALGPGVTGVRTGDRVTATLFPLWQDGPLSAELLPQLGGTLDGLLTERAILPAAALVPIPSHLTYAEAATLPCAAVTAWNALTGGGRPVGRGQTVVATGSGGVSLFVLQLGKLLGARVIVTTGRRDKEAQLLGLGADAVVNYRAEPDWAAAVRSLTGGRGADRVVDTAGTLADSLRAVTIDGQVALVGSVTGDWPPLDPRLLFGSAATLRSIAVGSRAQFLVMNAAITRHALRPLIDRVFPFEEARSAYHYYESESPLGKVVIAVR